jgi:hypothetical protein
VLHPAFTAYNAYKGIAALKRLQQLNPSDKKRFEELVTKPPWKITAQDRNDWSRIGDKVCGKYRGPLWRWAWFRSLYTKKM